MNYLGLACMLGRPALAVNYEKAIELFQRAADHGNVKAYSGPGVAYEKSLGVFRDRIYCPVARILAAIVQFCTTLK
jgi:TPR repeat protein